jgi:hypothetical protein
VDGRPVERPRVIDGRPITRRRLGQRVLK